MRPLFLTLLAACGVESAEEARSWEALDQGLLERVPPSVRGCGDATIAASNAADTRAMFLNLPGIVNAAHAAGRTITVTATLPDPSVGLYLQTGRMLTSSTCVGAFPWPGPTVLGQAEIAAGQITVTATPTGVPGVMQTGTLDIELQGLEFVTPAGGVIRAGDVEMYGVGVGLYPP